MIKTKDIIKELLIAIALPFLVTLFLFGFSNGFLYIGKVIVNIF